MNIQRCQKSLSCKPTIFYSILSSSFNMVGFFAKFPYLYKDDSFVIKLTSKLTKYSSKK